MTDDNFSAIYKNTHSIYERQAKGWHNLRTQTLFEKPFLDYFISHLPTGASVLDLGCGTGVAIADYFIKSGLDMTGVDYSKAMIAQAKERYPQSTWCVQDIKDIQLETQFDAVYSWHGFFHLSVHEQKEALPKIADLVKPGGHLMLTIGPSEGEVTGQVGGETVYHASLHPDDYKALLLSSGFERVEFKKEENGQGPFVIYGIGKA